MKAIRIVLALSLVSMAVSPAHAFEPFQGSATWDQYTRLPGLDTWSSMYQLAEEVAADLNSGGGQYTLVYKEKGGSSHQLLVRRVSDGKDVGLWSAPNHATYIEGEIFAFNLARLLNRPTWVTPGTRMTLTGPALALANRAFRPASTPKARQCNQAHILKYMQANPHYLTGVFKAFIPGKRPDSIPELVDRADKRRLDSRHGLVSMINRAGPKPTGAPVYLSRKKNLSYESSANVIAQAPDTELAKQLSFMTLIDALNSQRDRFGPYGSNLEAMIDSDGSFAITAVDNGGIADVFRTASVKYFLGEVGPEVSRFEREVAQRVLALDDFIAGRTTSFDNYSSVGELALALGVESSPNDAEKVGGPGGVCGKSNHMFLFENPKKRWGLRWNAFVQALASAAAHIRQYQGDDAAFFD